LSIKIMKNLQLLFITLFVLFLSSTGEAQTGSGLDLTNGVVVVSGTLSGPENKAVQMLIEEVARRAVVRLPRVAQNPGGRPVIAISRAGSGLPPEGYQIRTTSSEVTIIGNDARGVLFGVGHLLRSLAISENRIILPAALNVTTSPKYPLRGHQLGYRPKTNSYDAWDVGQWEQYIRDLAVWGTNAIELIPPRSDDDGDSPHFPLPPMKMMIEMSRICAEYGLDVWIWYPALDKDYADPATIEFALKEWGEVFRQLPRIDAVHHIARLRHRAVRDGLLQQEAFDARHQIDAARTGHDAWIALAVRDAALGDQRGGHGHAIGTRRWRGRSATGGQR
jgi:hypothetical protein